jgi:hypothetical protein
MFLILLNGWSFLVMMNPKLKWEIDSEDSSIAGWRDKSVNRGGNDCVQQSPGR